MKGVTLVLYSIGQQRAELSILKAFHEDRLDLIKPLERNLELIHQQTRHLEGYDPFGVDVEIELFVDPDRIGFTDGALDHLEYTIKAWTDPQVAYCQNPFTGQTRPCL